MANDRIKGLTIEINGDTTGLSKALKDVNQELSSCQTNLRDVNRALKFDPGNVDLLKVKQSALNDEIAAAKDKLEKERQAMEQLKQSDGFDANSRKAKDLETQIALDESALKRLTEEAKNFGSVGQQQFKAAGEALKQTGDKMTRAGKTMTTSVTAPVVALGTAAVKTTMDFDTSMSKVAAISGATGDDLDALRNKAREMGADTKFSASEAADAMTYMAMAGWKTGDMLDGVKGIMDLAAASGESLATTSDIVTDALTAFGLSASDSTHFADVLAAASNNANTNVGMLGESFKYVAPVAGAMGYSVEDVTAALGLMANSGIKASSAGTALRTILTNMAKPTDTVQMAMDKLGLSLDDGAGGMKSFRQIMDDLRSGFGDLMIPEEEFNRALAELTKQYEEGQISEKAYNAELNDLMQRTYGAEGALKAQYAASLAGKTGLSGLMAIVNASPEDYDKMIAAMDNCDGTAEHMADVMQDNLGGQITILMSKLSELAISFGDLLMPAIRKATDAIGSVIDWLNNLDDGTKQTIATIAGVVAAIGPVLLIGGKLITGIGSVITAVGSCGTAFTAITSILSGPVVAAIATAVAAGVLIVKNWDSIKSAANTAWTAVKTTITGAWSGIKSAVSSAVSSVKSAIDTGWSNIKSAASTAWTAVKTTITGAWSGIKSAVSSALSSVKSAIDTGWSNIKSAAGTAWTAVKTTITGAWDGIKSAVGSALSSVKSAIDSAWSNIKSAAGTAWTAVKTTISGAWDGIKSVSSSAVSSMSSAISSGFNAVKNTASSIFNSIKSAISTAMDAAKSAVSNAIDRIKSAFNFSWSLPKLKMPHVTISGSFSLNPPSVPKFGIDWYAKAMKGGMILNNPTIFGAMGGKLLGAGEAGSETVVGTRNLMQMIQHAVSNAGNTTNYGGINIVVYGAPGQDVNQLADIVAAQIDASVRRKGAVFA